MPGQRQVVYWDNLLQALKKNVYNFFESKNIFPSIPKKIDLLILPILINNESEEVVFISENPVYKNWNNNFS